MPGIGRGGTVPVNVGVPVPTKRGIVVVVLGAPTRLGCVPTDVPSTLAPPSIGRPICVNPACIKSSCVAGVDVSIIVVPPSPNAVG